MSPPSTTLTATPTGTVTLSADGNGLGTSTLKAGQSSFRASFEKGTHAVVAQYSGDATYGPASGTYSLSVTVDVTSLSVTSSQAVTWFGQPVTFTARLGTAATGTVQFSEGATLIGSALLTAGVANLTVADLPAGTHAITASWGAASAQFVQTVSRANTVTVCSFGSGVVRAVVSAVAPGAGMPTGTVRLLDAATNAVLSTTVLDSGIATAAITGGGQVVAVYSGDANFLGSSSAVTSPLAAVNAASYSTASVAPDEIVTLFGQNLPATQPVTVTDSKGVSRTAPLLFVSPEQASVVMPADLALGPATIRAENSRVEVAVTATAPGLFTIDGSAPAAQIISIHADGSRDVEQVTGAAIDAGDSVYLVLYGTGIRHFVNAPSCTIGTVLFAGAQEGFFGTGR